MVRFLPGLLEWSVIAGLGLVALVLASALVLRAATVPPEPPGREGAR